MDLIPREFKKGNSVNEEDSELIENSNINHNPDTNSNPTSKISNTDTISQPKNITIQLSQWDGTSESESGNGNVGYNVNRHVFDMKLQLKTNLKVNI